MHQGKMPRGRIFMRHLREGLASGEADQIDPQCQSVSVGLDKGRMTKCWDLTAD